MEIGRITNYQLTMYLEKNRVSSERHEAYSPLVTEKTFEGNGRVSA